MKLEFLLFFLFLSLSLSLVIEQKSNKNDIYAQIVYSFVFIFEDLIWQFRYTFFLFLTQKRSKVNIQKNYNKHLNRK